MKLYEVWTPRGAVAGYGDKGLADKAFRKTSSPALLTLGASVLAVREGTTAKQRAAIEEALKAARAEGEVIDVPKADPAKVHRLPLVAARPTFARVADTDDSDTDDSEDSDDSDSADAAVDADADDDDADDSDSTDARTTTDETAVERAHEAAAPAPTTKEVSVSEKIKCKSKVCDSTFTPVEPRGNGVLWRHKYCPRCRDRGRKAIEAGRATAETVGVYLDVRDHHDTTEATKARMAQRTAKKVAKVPRVAPAVAPAAVAPAAVAPAAPASDDTIQVTITLPNAVARAYRCALAVGGVEALERLVAALPTAVRS